VARWIYRLIELMAVAVAAIPVVRLEWWAVAVAAPALVVAFVADHAARA